MEVGLGSDPLVNPAQPWRYAALLVPAAVLLALAVVGFVWRDVLAA